MLDAFRRHRDAGIVGNIQLRAATGELDHAGIIVNLCGKPEHLDRSQGRLMLPFAFSERPAVTAACCLVPRELFNQLGGFDEVFVNGGEDVDFCFRLRQRRRRVFVANRSVVRHHVSASPGRKARDEINSRILCRRWREEFIRLGARCWPRAYLREHWLEPRNYEPRLLLQAFLRWTGVLRSPAPHALAVVQRNLDHEEAHWRATLGLAEKSK
jgi:GT2 family glycosyltransferase